MMTHALQAIVVEVGTCGGMVKGLLKVKVIDPPSKPPRVYLCAAPSGNFKKNELCTIYYKDGDEQYFIRD